MQEFKLIREYQKIRNKITKLPEKDETLSPNSGGPQTARAGGGPTRFGDKV